MSDVVYKLFVETNTSADSAAQLDIQNDGFIEGVLMDVSCAAMDALSDSCSAEVSFMSTNTFGTNDVRGSIMILRTIQNFLTSGGGAQGKSQFVALQKGIPVFAGERIHLHVTMSAGLTINVQVFLYTRSLATRRTDRRRR